MKKMKENLFIILSVSIFALNSSIVIGAEKALGTKPVLPLQIAKKMVDACEEIASKEGWNMNIAIVDDGANLLLFRRMPNAFLGSIDIAINKAKTSARFQMASRTLEEVAYGKDLKGGKNPGVSHVKGIIVFAGGLPIKVKATTIGGIGVSGASADQDEVCAQAGIDVVEKFLK